MARPGRHEGTYGKLQNTREIFEIGMNRAVDLLAQSANRKGGGRGSREPLKVLGKTEAGDEVKLMDGRYGAYVTDGSVNATLPKDVGQEDLTLEKALELIAAKAAKGPAKKKRKAPAKKTAAKKKAPAKKKAAAKS